MMIASFVAAAFYHLTPWKHPRPFPCQIDLAAVHLKNPTTFKPLIALMGIDVLIWQAIGYEGQQFTSCKATLRE